MGGFSINYDAIKKKVADGTIKVPAPKPVTPPDKGYLQIPENNMAPRQPEISIPEIGMPKNVSPNPGLYVPDPNPIVAPTPPPIDSTPPVLNPSPTPTPTMPTPTPTPVIEPPLNPDPISSTPSGGGGGGNALLDPVASSATSIEGMTRRRRLQQLLKSSLLRGGGFVRTVSTAPWGLSGSSGPTLLTPSAGGGSNKTTLG